jgi:hypothetical protein
MPLGLHLYNLEIPEKRSVQCPGRSLQLLLYAVAGQLAALWSPKKESRRLPANIGRGAVSRIGSWNGVKLSRVGTTATARCT